MNRSKRLLIILVAGISLFLISASVASAKTTTLRFAIAEKKRPLTEETYEWFAKEVAKQTEGRVKVKLFYASTLCSVKEMAKCVKNGIADIGWITPVYHPGNFMLSLVPMMHDVFFDGTVVDLVQYFYKFHDQMPAITEGMARNKMVPIAYSPISSMQLWLTKPLNSIGDIKGTKIRTVGKLQQVAFKGLGATPTMVSAFETFGALQKNILNGVVMSTDLVASLFKFHTISKQLVVADFSSTVAVWAMSLERYNNLTPEDQKTLQKLGRELSMRAARTTNSSQKRYLAQVKKENPKMAVMTLSEADKHKVRNLPHLKVFRQRFIGAMEKKGIPMAEGFKIWGRILAEQ